MSSNLKGSNPVVRFLLGHGEKIWIAGIVVCAGMLFWSALGREQLEDDNTPEDLQNLISQANSRVQEFNWESVPEDQKFTASTVSTESMKPIEHKHFPPFEQKLDTRVLDPVKLRSDPELLAVQDLEVYGDSGILATATEESIKAKKLQQRIEQGKKDRDRLRSRAEDPDEFGDVGRNSPTTTVGKGGVIIESAPGSQGRLQGMEDTKAVSWVTVVGKIPIKDQYLRYQNALARTRNYNKRFDVPDYIGYRVLRSEVLSTGEGKWKVIANVMEKTILKENNQNVSKGPSLVAGKYTHPLLTFPLPSLLLREWGRDISHSEIPLIEEENKIANESEVVTETDEEAAVGDEVGFGSTTSPRKRRTNSMRRQPDVPDEYQSRDIASPSQYQGGGTGDVAELQAYVWDNTTESLLFRYVDRSVEPGKQYRYKIQLVLHDVNNDADEAYLDKSVIERRAEFKDQPRRLSIRFAPESEPSPVASVPMLARIFVAGSKPAREDSYTSEPELKLLLKTYDEAEAIEAARIDSIKRGNVANVSDSAIVLWTSSKTDQPKTDFNFFTDITMLDVVGGETLNRKNRDLIAPTRSIMMDASGQLFVQSQLKDFESVSAYEEIVDRQKNIRPSPSAEENGPRTPPPGGRSRSNRSLGK